MLTDRGLNDRVLYSEVPERVRGRLNLPREALDKELGGTRKGKMATGLMLQGRSAVGLKDMVGDLLWWYYCSCVASVY